jgi:NTP pyrophosphatase (non-canonical NTP hydrolase)
LFGIRNLMNFDDYQVAALRTAKRTLSGTPAREREVLILGLGIAGEAGEVADLLKKGIGHEHGVDRDKLCEEIGDVIWYCAALADSYGLTLSKVVDVNVTKLLTRYPNGFSVEASKNRVDTGSSLTAECPQTPVCPAPGPFDVCDPSCVVHRCTDTDCECP